MSAWTAVAALAPVMMRRVGTAREVVVVGAVGARVGAPPLAEWTLCTVLRLNKYVPKERPLLLALPASAHKRRQDPGRYDDMHQSGREFFAYFLSVCLFCL